MSVIDSYIPKAHPARLRCAVVSGKVVVVYGPRRVGKTASVRRYVQEYDRDALVVTGEDVTVRAFLESQLLAKLKAFVGGGGGADRGRDPIRAADRPEPETVGRPMDGLRIVATGSSSFDLAQQTGEPLTGRKATLLLLPLAQLEFREVESAHETAAHLETRLIYGSYPEVVLMASNEDRVLYLKELAAASLFKDILQLVGIRHIDKLLCLLQLVRSRSVARCR